MPPLLASACPLADGHNEAFGPSFQVIAEVTLEYADPDVPDQEIEFEFIMDYHQGICALCVMYQMVYLLPGFLPRAVPWHLVAQGMEICYGGLQWSLDWYHPLRHELTHPGGHLYCWFTLSDCDPAPEPVSPSLLRPPP
ncbi:uncharacterized protein ATNIH1004_011780 [Aspergillus tanneri]|uniref:Uncharacterized protein n=1 Tax=Aspergillus tanneri TaxID=1220188 RepID=A0A5M9M8H2_9EURO|nr:uncharacterized protein ATNIH1004_011780 [Aspergillus tanneri]KAA8641644.1 hypothetical protein ATNIH1004_011780 [Aspergillus tanneri]